MIDEFQLQDQLSFLNESSPQLNPKIHDSFYPQAVDAVELVVRKLETNPLFNPGRGSTLMENGTVEMEASIMDGAKSRYGVVADLTTVKNPISLAFLSWTNHHILIWPSRVPKSLPGNRFVFTSLAFMVQTQTSIFLFFLEP